MNAGKRGLNKSHFTRDTEAQRMAMGLRGGDLTRVRIDGRRRKGMAETVTAIPVAPVVISSELQPVVSPEESLRLARNAANAAMPTIIEAIVKVAKSGSCQHAKFLMEFAREEQKTKTAVTAEEDEESLAALLLREIREAEAEEQKAG